MFPQVLDSEIARKHLWKFLHLAFLTSATSCDPITQFLSLFMSQATLKVTSKKHQKLLERSKNKTYKESGNIDLMSYLLQGSAIAVDSDLWEVILRCLVKLKSCFEVSCALHILGPPFPQSPEKQQKSTEDGQKEGIYVKMEMRETTWR